MYINIDILNRRVLHGNVTFVWLWWPDWVTVLSAKLVRKWMNRFRGLAGHLFSMSRCQNIRTLISSCNARFARPHSRLWHSLSLIQLPFVL